jgi:hypothetical protein
LQVLDEQLYADAAFGGTLGAGEAHGLFDEYVLTGLESGQRERLVQVRRQADIDGVDVGIGEEFFSGCVLGDVGEIELLARAPEVALNAAHVTGTLDGVAFCDGGERGSRNCLQPLQVGAAHES